MLKWVGCDEAHGGKIKTNYVVTFQEYLPVQMGELTQYIYNFVEEWELNDLAIPEGYGNEGSGGGAKEEAK